MVNSHWGITMFQCCIVKWASELCNWDEGGLLLWLERVSSFADNISCQSPHESNPVVVITAGVEQFMQECSG